MIVIGADTHKSSHTLVAVDQVTGRQVGVRRVASTGAGAFAAVRWARGLPDPDRVWAIEDCRHVSGRLERLLISAGETVVRVPPRLMAGARRSQRERGKSDPIDALAVARAAIREGVDRLPAARLDGAELDVRLLLDHHDDLVVMRSQCQQRLRWHLHDLYDDLDVPAGGLDRAVWLDRVARRLARGERTVRVGIARDLVGQIRTATRRIRELEREISLLVDELCPQLVAEPGCGPLTAAKLVGEIAGLDRFPSDAKLARAAGVAPIPVSSGRRDRHRLDRGGNRQLNLALHRFAVNRARRDPATAAYLARKQAEGKTRMEALRCLKRHLARRVWHLLHTPTTTTGSAPKPALALT
ncbi:MAG TPA: IS110 family transposase [Gaiellales bacterium]|jgi:transposase|nr:IS110 family transposase [Gaiellales bacterium]